MSENNELEGIIERVKENVVGQDVAIENVCSLIDIGEKRFKLLDKWDLGPSEEPQFCSALLIGSSGTGKTFMLKNIAHELDMIFWEIDATTITAEGWSGSSFRTQWSLLSRRLEDESEKMALVFIDEVDKILKDDGYSGSAKFDLLKPLEGGVWRSDDESGHNTFEINFNRCVFVLSGAFAGIEKFSSSMGFLKSKDDSVSKQKNVSREDLIKWGAPRELVGRFSLILNLDELKQEDYKKIIDTQIRRKYSSLSPNLDFKVDGKASELLASEAMTKKLGARYINQRINEILTRNIWREVSHDNSISYVATLIVDDGQLSYRIKKEKGTLQEGFVNKRCKNENVNQCAKIIRNKVDNARGSIKNLDIRKKLSSDIFECMSALKYESKNISDFGEGKIVKNEFSDAELDLLFCMICTLRYCYPDIYYNFDQLRSMLTMCWVNYVGWSPFESYFNDIKAMCEKNLLGKVPAVNLLDETCCEYKKSNCQGEHGFISSSHTKENNSVRVDELLLRVSKEFIHRPQSERDEAVKMLAWRMI